MTAAASSGSPTAAELDDAWERLGRPSRDAAARRARARLRGGAVGRRRPRARRGRRRLPDRPEPSRRGDPRRIRARPRRSRPRSRQRATAIGDDARRRDGPVRHADRRAVPARATARWSSTSWRRASTTAATGRSRAPRPRSSSSTSGRSAGCGLGSTAALGPTAMVNLLGTGPRRPARLTGVADALADPAVHLHLYDKRDVFERRKMGHLTALARRPRTQALARRDARLGRHSTGQRRHDGGRPMTRGGGSRPIVGIVGGSRSDFPTLEAAVAVLDELGVAVGAQGRLGAPDPGPAVPLRRGGRRPRDQGHHRGRRRRRPPARDARREDGPARHRRPDPDPAPGRARLAAVDRPDAARRARSPRSPSATPPTPGSWRRRSWPCRIRRSPSASPPGAPARPRPSSTTPANA